MAFQKKTVDGEYDPKINLNGRPKGDGKKLTNRQIREREFLSLLRKVKPMLADSVSVASKILKNEEATHANRLKACVIIVELYKDMVESTYDEKYDEDEGEEVQPTNKSPVFSLTIVGGDKDKVKE